MAKLFFNKNCAGVQNTLVCMAESQSVVDSNRNFEESLYDVFDISAEDFTAIKNGTKYVISHNGTDITYGTPDQIGFQNQANLDQYIQGLIERFDEYLKNNSNKPLASQVTAYKTFIQNLDTSEMTPMSKSLEKYAADQGQTFIHPLELI